MTIIFISLLAYALVKSYQTKSYLLFPVVIGLCYSPFTLTIHTLGLTPQKIALLVCAPIVIGALLKARKLTLGYSFYLTVGYFISMLWLEVLVAFLNSNGNSALVQLLSNLSVFLFTYFLVSKPENQIKAFAKPTAISIILLVPIILPSYFQSLNVLNYVSGDRIGNSFRLGSSEMDSLVNVWAYSLVTAMSLMNYCYSKKFKDPKNVTKQTVILVLIANMAFSLLILFSLSRGATILMFLSLLLIFPIPQIKVWAIILCSVLILLVSLDPVSNLNLVADRLAILGTAEDTSYNSRLAVYGKVLSSITNSPILGVGSEFPSLFNWATENTFLFTIMRYGIIGFSIFSLYFIQITRLSINTKNIKLLIIALVYCFFDDTLFVSTFWILIGYISALNDIGQSHAHHFHRPRWMRENNLDKPFAG